MNTTLYLTLVAALPDRKSPANCKFCVGPEGLPFTCPDNENLAVHTSLSSLCEYLFNTSIDWLSPKLIQARELAEDGRRTLKLVYGLMIPEEIALGDGYRWANLEECQGFGFETMDMIKEVCGKI